MATASRTKTKGVKGKAKTSKNPTKDLSKYVNYIPEGEVMETSDSFLDYVFLLYGESGGGKTSTLAQAPGAYTIQCDPNRKGLKIRQTNIPNTSLEEMDKNRRAPTPWEILSATVDAILEDDSVSTVIFDNFKNVYKYASEHYCSKNRIKALFEMKDFGASWDIVDSMYTSIFERIISSGRGLGLITHQKEKTVELPSGKEFDQIMPDLSGRALSAVRQFTNFAFYICRNEKGERELLIRHKSNDIWTKCCTDANDHRFFTPEGKPVEKISLGNSPNEGWDNWMKSWNNLMPCSASSRSKIKKKQSKKKVRKK